MSTKDVGRHFQLDPCQRSELLSTGLAKMVRDGLMERVINPGQRLRYRRRTRAGDQHVQGAAGTP